jgi:hypothetical protein
MQWAQGTYSPPPSILILSFSFVWKSWCGRQDWVYLKWFGYYCIWKCIHEWFRKWDCQVACVLFLNSGLFSHRVCHILYSYSGSCRGTQALTGILEKGTPHTLSHNWPKQAWTQDIFTCTTQICLPYTKWEQPFCHQPCAFFMWLSPQQLTYLGH